MELNDYIYTSVGIFSALSFAMGLFSQAWPFLKKHWEHIVPLLFRNWSSNWEELPHRGKGWSHLIGDKRSHKGIWDSFPMPGWYFRTFEGTRLAIQVKTSEELPKCRYASHWYLKVYSFRNVDLGELCEKIGDSGEQHLSDETSDKILIALHGKDQNSVQYLYRTKRPPESLAFEGDIHVEIAKDAQKFLDDKDEYLRRGLPHVRTYLLHGTPGNGKSSIPIYVAGALDKELRVLPPNTQVSPTAVQGQVVVIDDLDAWIGVRPDMAAEAEAEVNEETKSDVPVLVLGGNQILWELLNVLDGPLSPEETIVFLTTNFRERLDPALIRPGRVDMEFQIGDPGKKQVRQLFRNFFPEGDADAFVEVYGNRDYCAAALIEHFKRHPSHGAAADKIQALDERLKKKPKRNGLNGAAPNLEARDP